MMEGFCSHVHLCVCVRTSEHNFCAYSIKLYCSTAPLPLFLQFCRQLIEAFLSDQADLMNVWHKQSAKALDYIEPYWGGSYNKSGCLNITLWLWMHIFLSSSGAFRSRLLVEKTWRVSERIKSLIKSLDKSCPLSCVSWWLAQTLPEKEVLVKMRQDPQKSPASICPHV